MTINEGRGTKDGYRMRLFLECAMGASGDMLMSALYDLLPDKNVFREKMERLSLPGVTFEYSTSTKCGISGTHISVKVGGVEEKSEDIHAESNESAPSHDAHSHDDGHSHTRLDEGHGDGSSEHSHDHDHSHDHEHDHEHDHDHGHSHGHSGRRLGYKEITDLIRSLDLPDNVQENALGVYKILGEAEAAVHGVPLNKIHFHEIGSLDAVADIVGCCLLMNLLNVTDVTASPVHVGSGSIRCEHGILPVPAPAAAEILKDVPIYGGKINGELCTPTGAALLKRFVRQFGEMPPMIVKKIGCGMGAKDFEAANCLRAFLSEDEASDGGSREMIYELSCNLDDMSPEAVGAVFGLLFENGALDVYTTPVMMKKNRHAVMLSCLCIEEKRDSLARLLLINTSTLGVRISSCRRYVMARSEETVSTMYGDIRIKRAHGFGAIKAKPEYDDVLKASKRFRVPFMTVYDAASRACTDK